MIELVAVKGLLELCDKKYKSHIMNMTKSIINHPKFILYFKNTSWLFAEKILRMVVGFFNDTTHYGT